MPHVPPLSKESESRLFDCLEKIAELQSVAGDDADVNAIFADAATDAGVPAGHLPLLVNAYVTGKTAQTRRAGATVWDKAASFPIPDAEAVRALMFPGEVKTAARELAATVVSDDYSRHPSTWLRRRKEARDRLAARRHLADDPPPPSPTKTLLPETEHRRREGEWARAKRAAEESRRRASIAMDVCQQVFGELVESFKSASCPHTFGELFDNCLATRGDGVVPVFDALADAVGLVLIDRRTKTAAAELRPARGPLYDLVDRLLEARDAYQTLADDFVAKEAAERAAYDRLHPLPVGPDCPREIGGVPVETDAEKRAVMEWTKALGTLGAAPLQGVLSAPAAITQARAQHATAHLFREPKPDQKYQAVLEGVGRQGFLYDLLREHQGHDPHKVLLAYKELAGLAPRAGAQSAIMNDFVRKRLEGGPLSYFDLEALTRIEKNLKGVQGGGDDDRVERR